MKKKSDKLNFISGIKYVSQFLDGFRIQFVMFYFGWLFETIAVIISTNIFGIMINQIVYYKNIHLFIRIGVAFMLLSVFSCVMYYLIYQIYAYLWNVLNFRIRIRVFRHMEKLDAEYMADIKYGDVISLIQNQATECMHFIIRNIIHNINNVLKIIFCIWFVVLIDPMIAIAIITAVPISVFISIKFGQKVREESDKNRKIYGEYVGWLYEVLKSLKDIRLLGAESMVNTLFKAKQKNLIATEVKTSVVTLTANNIVQFSNIVLQLVIYAILAVLTYRQKIMIGDVIVTITYFGLLTNCLKTISESYMDSQARLAVIQRIHNFMETPTMDKWTGTKELQIKKGEIEISNLHFSFKNGAAILKGLNLAILPGERMAIVGESGCGKSTLTYILVGLYSRSSGYIKVDDMYLEKCTLKSIRKSIGLVQQECLIFDGTIRDNILLGKPHANETEIEFACKNAGIYEFIRTLPDKLETVIGTLGRELSGGQKQRIAIARVYLKDPKIIIFDEATSALDNDTEQLIHDAWRQALEGRTALVIAHRLSSVMMCDKVALIRDGRVKEIGIPSDMQENSSDFKTLFAIQ